MSEENVLSNKIEMKKVWQLLGIIAVTALIWNLPITCFGIEGLTVIQQRVIAIFVFATLSWLFEAIPSWATSLAIISVMCLTLSDNSIACFKGEGEAYKTRIEADGLRAPIKEGDVVGRLVVERGGMEVASTDLLAGADVTRRSFFLTVWNFLRSLVKG